MSHPPTDADRSPGDGDELFDLLDEWVPDSADELEAAMPSAEEFARLRSAVLERVAASRSGAGVGRRRLLPWAAGFAALFLGSGFLLGRGTGERPPRAEIARYENVRLEPLPDRRLRLTFDAVRPFEVEVSSGDPLAVEVLTQALTGGAASVGERLRAVELAASVPSPRLQQALNVAMRHDGNLGVRLAAQRGLVGADQLDGPDGGDAVDAMLALLREDGPLPMYLVAIDYLERRGVEPWRVREALRGSPPGSPATLLLARSQAAGGFLAESVVH